MLSVYWKKVLLSFHLVFACLWIGSLFSITVFLLIKDECFSSFQLKVVDHIIFTIHDAVIVNSSLLLGFSGLLFSTFTQWGILKFRLIICKWIGINSGEVVAGNLGSETKIEFSITGDTVNTGKRIEILAKDFGNSILISEPVYQKTKGLIKSKELEPINVKGKKSKIMTHQVLLDNL